ncbi:hypothetical protein GCM10011499_26660 [Pelagibacterium lentulum]|uniref:Uncharacterized protein n=1 Tax=Pelagibacterium lentulum TaxID=2029865 RepID=A0A916VZJ8_9HYPH|nr:hypothetical protein GCM10011499_26660 [Pelagibacterium lentulum]
MSINLIGHVLLAIGVLGMAGVLLLAWRNFSTVPFGPVLGTWFLFIFLVMSILNDIGVL